MATEIILTSTVDVSRINAAIPKIVAFGRRTLQQQCVTSAYWVCKYAKDDTLKMEPDTIDARVSARVVAYTNPTKNRVSKAKRRTTYRTVSAVGKSVPLWVLVVMARMNPGSNYTNLTGGYWALSRNLLPTGKGTALARQQMIMALGDRMIAARRSSTAYLKSGFITPLRELFASPFMVKKQAAFRSTVKPEGLDAGGTRKIDKLGTADIATTGDGALVTVENLTPLGGNSALEARHAHYARLQLLPVLQAALEREADNIERIIAQRLADGELQRIIDV